MSELYENIAYIDKVACGIIMFIYSNDPIWGMSMCHK